MTTQHPDITTTDICQAFAEVKDSLGVMAQVVLDTRSSLGLSNTSEAAALTPDQAGSEVERLSLLALSQASGSRAGLQPSSRPGFTPGDPTAEKVASVISRTAGRRGPGMFSPETVALSHAAAAESADPSLTVALSMSPGGTTLMDDAVERTAQLRGTTTDEVKRLIDGNPAVFQGSSGPPYTKRKPHPVQQQAQRAFMDTQGPLPGSPESDNAPDEDYDAAGNPRYDENGKPYNFTSGSSAADEVDRLVSQNADRISGFQGRKKPTKPPRRPGLAPVAASAPLVPSRPYAAAHQAS